MAPTWGLRVRWMFTSLIFFGLPILGFLTAGSRYADALEREERERVWRQLDHSLATIRQVDATEKHLAVLIRREFQRALAAPDVPAAMQALVGKLRRLPGAVRFHCAVLHRGGILPGISEGSPPRLALRRLHGVLLDASSPRKDEGRGLAEAVPEPAAEPSRRLALTLLGPQAKAEHLSGALDTFQEVSYLPLRHWFFAAVATETALFVHADGGDDWTWLALRDRCRRFSRRFSGESIHGGLTRLPRGDARREDGRRGRGMSPLDRALQGFSATRLSRQRFGDDLFVVEEVSPRVLLWARKTCSVTGKLVPWRAVATAGGIFLFALLAIWQGRLTIGLVGTRRSIRWHLLALFAFAGGIPVGVILLTSWDWLDQIYRFRVRQEQERNAGFLRTFDQGFERMRLGMQTRLQKLAERSSWEPGAGREAALRQLRRFWQAWGRPAIYLVSQRGGLVWQAEAPGPTQIRFRNLMVSLTPHVLAGLGTEKTAAPLAGGFNSNNAYLATDFAKSLGRLTELQLAGNLSFQWMAPLADASGEARWLVMVLWTRAELEGLYLERFLPAHRRLGDRRFLFAADTGDLSRRWPAAHPLLPRLQELMTRVVRTDATWEAIVPWGGEDFLATGLRPRNLSGTVLVALQGDRVIRQEIVWGSRLLLAFVALASAVSLFFGVALAASLLRPLGHLGEGVTAISRGRFDHRLPPGEPDELGALADLLNRVLTGMEDLEVARLVQASLFPTEERRVGAYRVHGSTRSMTQLGGDYFDLQPLPGDRLLLLIGDVAGHGVQAGLVMAMAKALVTACLRDAAGSGEEVAPGTVLGFLQTHLFAAIRKRSMITCLVGLLDAREHRLDLALAGQPAPCLFRRGQSPRMLDCPPAQPLMPRRRPGFPTLSVPLLSGDRLLFYTDGLVEGLGSDGQSLGYELPFRAADRLMDDDPARSARELHRWHAARTGEAGMTDDVTLLCVFREVGS